MDNRSINRDRETGSPVLRQNFSASAQLPSGAGSFSGVGVTGGVTSLQAEHLYSGTPQQTYKILYKMCVLRVFYPRGGSTRLGSSQPTMAFRSTAGPGPQRDRDSLREGSEARVSWGAEVALPGQLERLGLRWRRWGGRFGARMCSAAERGELVLNPGSPWSRAGGYGQRQLGVRKATRARCQMSPW